MSHQRQRQPQHPSHQLPPQLLQLQRQARKLLLLCNQWDRLPGSPQIRDGAEELLNHLHQEQASRANLNRLALSDPRQLDLFPDL